MRSLPKSTRIMFTPNSGNQVIIFFAPPDISWCSDISFKLTSPTYPRAGKSKNSSLIWFYVPIIFLMSRLTPLDLLAKSCYVPFARKSSSAGNFLFVFLFKANSGRKTFFNLNVIFVAINFHPGRHLRTTQWVCMGRRKVLNCPRGWISRWVETWTLWNTVM